MARVILDTNNVLGATEALPTEIAGPTLKEFIELLKLSRRSPEGFLLVCDGTPWEDAPRNLPSGMKLTFSGHGVTADDVIARVVSKSSISRQLLVVTTDRALQTRVRRHKASTMDSKAFLEELGLDWARESASPKPPSETPNLDPNTVLPPDVMAEAESVKPQKSDTSPSIWDQISPKSVKSRDPVEKIQPDKPLDEPPHGGFSFDPKTLEDAERIAKGHPPHDP